MTRTVVVLCLLVAGCDEPVDTRCGAASDSVSTVEQTGTATLVVDAPSVKIRGTAHQDLGLAIRRVTVAGLDATSDSFNFSAWSIDVPADVIEGVAGMGATAALVIEAFDTCNGDEIAAATQMATVAIVP